MTGYQVWNMDTGEDLGVYPTFLSALGRLQRRQPFSFDYAEEHGGWRIKFFDDEGDE